LSELATLLQGAVQERHAARHDVGTDAPVTLPRDALWAYRDRGPVLDD
jgi:iron(III) transport system ATP-binding protein